MRILLKCPTRSRPQKVIQTLATYVKLANHPEQLGVAVSCDEDDTTMTRNLVQEELLRALKPVAWKRIFFSANKTKIQACNANMNDIDWKWDIVVLVSDDMIPQIQGYDDVIRNHMISKFPDTNGILWVNDGAQGEKLNTLSIYGRAMYESFGYIYYPEYNSLFCDTELTDLCRGELASKCLYIPYSIIRHEHPGAGYTQNMDGLYVQNQRFWSQDMNTYIRRKTYPYDWSVLIPTIPGREAKLRTLVESIRDKTSRICPELRVEFCIAYDNREKSIGLKRQQLLTQAKGKYVSFIDDDDEITDAYIEDLNACFQGGFHCMRLRGITNEQLTFTHSIDVKLTDMMATQDDPPIFQRPPNHLNPMLADIAKLVQFKDATYGEDADWTLSLLKSNILQSEYRSDLSRIHYLYDNRPGAMTMEELVNYQRTATIEKMLTLVFTPTVYAQPKKGGLKLGPRGFVSK